MICSSIKVIFPEIWSEHGNRQASKIDAIKAIRSLSRMDLRDAKALVESNGPQFISLMYINNEIKNGRVLEQEKEVYFKILRNSGVIILEEESASEEMNAAVELKKSLQDLIQKAIDAEQYDLSKSLIDVLKQYN